MNRYFVRHIDERRLAALADALTLRGASASSAVVISAGIRVSRPDPTLESASERAHLDACARCARLLVGHERTLRMLRAPWAEQTIPAPVGRELRPTARTHGVQRTVVPALRFALMLIVLASVGLGLLTFDRAGGFAPRPEAGARATASGMASEMPTTTSTLDLTSVPGCFGYSIGPQSGPLKLRIQEPDGDRSTTLDHDRTETSISFSPDGKRIAFLVRVGADEHDELYVSDADGSDAHRVTDRYAGWPSWSPDGSWIAFVDLRSANSDIFLVHPDGTGVRQLSAFQNMTLGDPDRTEHPWGRIAWSPDSRTVATAVTASDQHADIWVWDVATGAHRVITTGLLSSAADPAWSADGSRIAFSGSQGPTSVDLWTVSPNGGPLQRLAAIAGYESGPAWSPDGRYLAFNWNTDSVTRPPEASPVTDGAGTGDNLSNIGVLRLSDHALASVIERQTPPLFPGDVTWCPKAR